MGIGLDSGRFMSGNIGPLRRLEYTVHGDIMNTACRIEGMPKTARGPDPLAESTRPRAPLPHDDLRHMGEFKVRGRDSTRLAVDGQRRTAGLRSETAHRDGAPTDAASSSARDSSSRASTRSSGRTLHVPNAGHRDEERLTIERVELRVSRGRDRRSTRHVVDESDLAEPLAATTSRSQTSSRMISTSPSTMTSKRSPPSPSLMTSTPAGTGRGSRARASDSSVGGGSGAKSGIERSSAISTTGTVA